MPTGVDRPRYEAFMALSDENSHGVIAIIGDLSGTKARPFVDVEHAAAAARLADALNSRLLAAPTTKLVSAPPWTAFPVSAATSWLADNAAVIAGDDHPVAAVMSPASTGNA